MPSKKHLIQFFLLVACVAACAEIIFLFGLFHTAQEKIVDRFYLNRPQSEHIVVVAIDDVSIGEIGQWPWPRAAFAHVLLNLVRDESNKPRAIGIDVSFSETSRLGTQDDAALASILSYLQALQIPVVLPVDLDSRNIVMSEPLPPFKSASHQGFINLPLDGDGVARHSESARTGAPVKSFSSVIAGTPDVPEKFRIDYRGSKGFVTVSFADLAGERLPARIFKDKIVLIGATAPNLHDVVATPFNTIPGVIANANAVETILQGRYFKNVTTPYGMLWIALVALCVSLLVRYIKKIIPLIAAITLLFIAIFAGSSVGFSNYIVVPILYYYIAFFLALVSALIFQYITESREKEFIRKSFQYYLTPHVIDELIKNPEKLTLGGEGRHMTILFSDIRGFTTISESLTPHQLTELLNQYLTAMTDIIMAHGGVVDKYIGDAIMAFWGAPLDNPSQAVDAAQSAAEMISRLGELNPRWIRPLDIGIGINSGTVVVGNMGSQKRFNYTVMGDDVNLASRLESLTKYYGVKTIVSEATRGAIPGMQFRELDVVVVKGKKEPTRLFELITDTHSKELTDALKFFERGRASYTAGNWAVALAEFEQAVILNDDGPSKLFIERCKKFQQHPPTAWAGVYTFESK